MKGLESEILLMMTKGVCIKGSAISEARGQDLRAMNVIE
jgi:hypothetical protein